MNDKPNLKCPTCGKAGEIKALPFTKMEFLVMKCHCAETVEKKKRELAARDAIRQKAIAGNMLLDKYGFRIPARFINEDFQTFKQDRNPIHYKAVVNYTKYVLEQKAKGKELKSLMLFGPIGCGKSHLAASCMKVLRKHNLTVAYCVIPEMLHIFKSTIGKRGINESDILDAILDADMVILDDVTRQKPSEWVYQRIYEIVNGRYNAMRSVFITVNGSQKEMENTCGKDVVSRIYQMCGAENRVSVMDVKDYRDDSAK